MGDPFSYRPCVIGLSRSHYDNGAHGVVRIGCVGKQPCKERAEALGVTSYDVSPCDENADFLRQKQTVSIFRQLLKSRFLVSNAVSLAFSKCGPDAALLFMARHPPSFSII